MRTRIRPVAPAGGRARGTRVGTRGRLAGTPRRAEIGHTDGPVTGSCDPRRR